MSAAVNHGNAFKNETGNKYGLLTVLSLSHYNEKSHAYFWNCKCECGKIKTINGNTLRNSQSTSCGCVRVTRWIGNKLKQTHGGSYTRLYGIWHGIKARCYTKSHCRFDRYGGRGITVCEEWKNDFTLFRKWAFENGYSENLTIDRINPNGNYEPNNCQWLTLSENSRKKRLDNKKKVTA